MVYLIDTNVIVRFLVKDNEAMYKEASCIFQKIKNFEIEARLEPLILAECFYVLTKLYKKTRQEVVLALKSLVSMENIYCDKILIFQTLANLEKKSIDFADAYLLAKSSLHQFGILSFDKDIKVKI